MNVNILVVEEVAKILRVSNEHIRKLVRCNELEAYKEGRKGGYRILEDSVYKYIKNKIESSKLENKK
jgi:excisionase family DNA binding protein